MVGVALVALSQRAALAAPADCLGTVCSVSAGGAVLAVDQFGEISLLSVNGSDQLFAEVLFVTPGVNSPMNPVTPTFIDFAYPITAATADDDANQITVVFSDALLSFTATYTLTAGPIGATVDYTIVTQNLTATPTDLTIVDYIDWDLRDDFHNDTISFVAPNAMRTTGKNAVGAAIAVSGFDFEDVGACCVGALFGRLVDGHLGGGVGPVGPTDVSGAFQNDITLAPNGSVTITRQLQALVPALALAPAPALSGAAIGLGLVVLSAVAALALRRRASGA